MNKTSRLMAANGLNAVRTYTAPPHCCWTPPGRPAYQVGLPVELYGLLIDQKDARILKRSCARPFDLAPGTVLCYVIGNEIPAPIGAGTAATAWSAPRAAISRGQKRDQGPGDVRELSFDRYLQLHFLDVVSFSVYLEKERKQAYLARLQNIAGDRPLLMSEIGWTACATARTHRHRHWTGKFERRLLRAAPARLSMPGRTNGIALAWTSTIGNSA
jgi:hypothetical protein